MRVAPEPHGETQRIRALHDLHILDTVDEERFDRVTRVASSLFNVPIALVSLVDADRQWFKSHHGLSACETPRDISFCAHVVYQQEVLIVSDARADERFHDNPLVTGEPGIRFYAGHPLRSPTGEAVGTLCLIDRKPREFTGAERLLLADLAAMVERELGLLVDSTQDPLTRLYNRRGLHEVGQHLLALCSRTQGGATLVSIDLDGFKAVNDGHGHEAGDRVIQWFAAQLLKHFRKSDVVARLGGDEFCVLTPQMREADVEACLARLADSFQQSPHSRRHPGLSWSCGITEFQCDHDVDLEAALARADAQMYEIKAARKRERAEGRSSDIQ